MQSSSTDALRVAKGTGWLLVAVGTVSVIGGVLAIVYPKITLLALAVITGINVLLLGVTGIVEAVTADRDAGSRALVAILGILGVLAGLLIIRRPGETLLVVLLAVGLWLILHGLVEVIVALTDPVDRGIRLLGGLADVVFGGLLLALPELSLGTVAVLTGIAFVVRGALTVYLGLQLRKLPAESTRGAAVTAGA